MTDNELNQNQASKMDPFFIAPFEKRAEMSWSLSGAMGAVENIIPHSENGDEVKCFQSLYK